MNLFSNMRQVLSHLVLLLLKLILKPILKGTR